MQLQQDVLWVPARGRNPYACLAYLACVSWAASQEISSPDIVRHSLNVVASPPKVNGFAAEGQLNRGGQFSLPLPTASP